MKNFLWLFAVLIVFGACQGNSTEAKQGEPVKESPKVAEVNRELHPKLQEVLPQCAVVEYAFFIDGMAMSSETKGGKTITNYYYFLDSMTVAQNPNCNYGNYEGGAVFRSREGDIKMTIDFAITQPDCRFAKVVIDNKTYLQQFTDSGIGYLMQFMQLRTKPVE